MGNEEACSPNPFRQSTSCAPTRFYRRLLPRNGGGVKKRGVQNFTPTRAGGRERRGGRGGVAREDTLSGKLTGKVDKKSGGEVK